MIFSPLDKAFQAFTETGDQSQLLGAIARSELFVATTTEVMGSDFDPMLVSFGEEPYIAVFDSAAKLSDFEGASGHFVSVSGRAIAQMLVGQNIGVVLNPKSHSWSHVLDVETLEWMAELDRFELIEDDLNELTIQPISQGATELVQALDEVLPAAMGLASCVFLVEVSADGSRHSAAIFCDAKSDAHSVLKQLIQEMVLYSGQIQSELSVGFVQSDSPQYSTFVRQGLRLDIPQPKRAATITAPGMDPQKPPKLR